MFIIITKVEPVWFQAPSRVVDALRLSVSKRHLDNAPSDMLELLVSPEEARQLDLMIFESPFQLNYSILCCRIQPTQQSQ